MSRLVNIFAREFDFIIQPYSRTTTGLRIGTEPIQKLPRDASVIELGDAIRRALLEVREGVAHPADWKAHLEPLLNCAKIQNWNDLQNSAKMCHVESEDRDLRVTPNRNGWKAGYLPITDQTELLALDSS